MKKTTTEKLAADALSPLIKHAQANRGTIKALTERLEKVGGKPVNRVMVEGWLHPDPSRRVEPRLGAGLLLIAVGGEIMDKAKEPKA